MKNILKTILSLCIITAINCAQKNKIKVENSLQSIKHISNNFFHYCEAKYNNVELLRRTVIETAAKMNVDVNGWNIKFMAHEDNRTCQVLIQKKTLSIGGNYLKNKSILRGAIAHELGHIKYGESNYYHSVVYIIGSLTGFALTRRIKNDYIKNNLVTQCAGSIFTANIATNLYEKSIEFYADTQAIELLKKENDLKGLNEMARFFNDRRHPIERYLGPYVFEVADTLISALTFEKITFLGEHPTHTSRAKRFQQAALKIKQI